MFASPLTHNCYDDINQSTLERRVAMADPTFIGNWNLFMGRISDEEGIRVQNSTWKIEPGNDGYVKSRDVYRRESRFASFQRFRIFGGDRKYPKLVH